MLPGQSWAAKKDTQAEPPPVYGDAALGRKYHKQIMAIYGPYDNANGLAGYVQRIGDEIAQYNEGEDFDWKFTVLDDESINAFALPGGYIYITRALLAHLNSEAQLAAVLGHEIGHSASRHSARQTAAADVVGNVAAAIGSGGSGFNLSELFGAGLVRGYGRDMELEADELGMKMISAAGYDPAAMFEVISILKAREKYDAGDKEQQENRYHAMLASHPDKDRRLRELADAQKVTGTVSRDDGRDTWLAHLDGTAWSGSTQQGVIRGSRFLHAEMNFSVDFPEGWTVHNLPDRVVAVPADGQAQIQIMLFDRTTRKLRKIPADRFLQKVLNLARWQNARVLDINGLESFIATAPDVNSSFGQRTARVGVVFYGDDAFVFSAVSHDNDHYRRYDSKFVKTIKSMQELSDADRKLAQPLQVQIIEMPADTRLADFAEPQSGEDPHALLQLINGFYPDGQPQPGDRIKIIR